MRITGEDVMATIRAAVAEQRAAAMALDSDRLNNANQRLSAAVEQARQKGVAEVPPESIEVASIQRDLMVNLEVVSRGQAAGARAVQAVSDTATLYGQSGAPATGAVPVKPIAAA